MASRTTGRPPGRPKTKYYTTLMGRIPQDLANRVQAYAGQHGQSISELIRAGLEWRITAGNCYPNFLSDRNRPSQDTGVPERDAFLSDRNETALDTLLSDTNRDELDALLEDTENPALDEIMSDINPAPAKIMSDTIPAFDSTKYVLGKLCPRGHAWGSTGQTLLTIAKRRCQPCEAAKRREKRRAAHA